MTNFEAAARSHDGDAPASWAVSPWTLPLFLVAHIVAWTAYACVAQSAGAVHHDMTEAWSWGQEFRLGYYKHPPLSAWIAGAWFQVFPRTDAFFYLLSQVNSAVGLAGVWMLAGRFLSPNGRLAAVLLLSLAPFNNVMAINFNANAMLLSVWPWTAFAFVRAVETGRVPHGVAFGALAAAAIMSKYFSLLLLAACFFSSLLHPRVRDIYRSPAPYVAVVTCLVLLIPHLRWVASHDWQTLEYAAHKVGADPAVVLYKTATTALASLALLGLPALVLFWAFGRQAFAMHVKAAARTLQREAAWIAALALTPFVSTLLTGLLGSVKISTNFMIPVFYMVPIAVLTLSRAPVTADRLRTIARAAVIYPVAALLASPVIAYVLFDRRIDLAAEPRRELAGLVTLEWSNAFGLPLRLVAGTNAYGTGVVFYSKDSPHEFTRLNRNQAPWVTHERLRQEGIAIVCIDKDADCTVKSARLLSAQGRHMHVSLRRTFLGMRGPSHGFEIYLIPPGPIPAIEEPLQHRN
jgi:4-amino-4-deoxy-L-arabinose transferase-like glycosyltransferase